MSIRHAWPTLFGLALFFSPPLCAQPPGMPPPAPAPYDTALFRTIRSGDAAALQKMLDAGADPNARQNDLSALMAATLAGSPDQMRVLLDHGAKPNYADHDSITALWLAIPDTAKTILLLDHGADPALVSKEHYNVLAKAANFAGATSLFQLLVAKGANPKKAAPDNMLLYEAASTNDTALVGLLLRYGFLPNDTIADGDYPINAAMNFRCFETLKMLVGNGANVNVGLPHSFFPNTRGITPLMTAALSDDESSFYYLLDHGADIKARSKSGYTALLYLQLCEADHPEMTKALLAHGADPSDKTRYGEDALILAAKKGNSASVQLLKHQ